MPGPASAQEVVGVQIRHTSSEIKCRRVETNTTCWDESWNTFFRIDDMITALWYTRSSDFLHLVIISCLFPKNKPLVLWKNMFDVTFYQMKIRIYTCQAILFSCQMCCMFTMIAVHCNIVKLPRLISPSISSHSYALFFHKRFGNYCRSPSSVEPQNLQGFFTSKDLPWGCKFHGISGNAAML